MGGSRPRASDSSFMGHLVHDNWFGGKKIGFFAGIALLINNITGPGVPQLPNMFAESGWLFPTVIFLLVWAMSSVSTTMYCEAMRRIPGNEHFRGRIEYTSIIDYYFGRKAYIAALIGLNGALQSLNIISVIQSAQVLDNAISAMGGHSCGINISPFALHVNGTELHESVKVWSCIDTNDINNNNAWGCHLIISGGYLLALAMTLPMGYFNLDDNMIIQQIAFILTIICWLIWLVATFFSPAFHHDGDYSLPAVATGKPYYSQAGVIGTILFNFGFVTTVPSWVNEKKPSVSVNKVVWLSTFLCVMIFFVMGIPPAMAFKKNLAGPATNLCEDDEFCGNSLMDIFTSNYMPEAIRNNKAGNFIVQLSVYLFPIVAVLSSIPVFSIVIKYNCVENGMSHAFSFFWGIVFPWVAALPLLYQPDALNQFINFSSLIFVSFTDFIVPWALYIKLQQQNPSKDQSNSSQLKGIQEDDNTDYPYMDSDEDFESDPLLNSVPSDENFDEGNLLRSSNIEIAEHYALPPSWNLTPKAKSWMSGSLVVVMTALAIAGTVLTILTSASMSWDCPAVSGG